MGALHDNATAKFLGMPSGIKGCEQIVRFSIDQFPRMYAQDMKVDFQGVYADADIVVVEMTLSATLANGRRYKNDYCFIHDLKDEKVAEIREFMDTYNAHRMFLAARPPSESMVLRSIVSRGANI